MTRTCMLALCLVFAAGCVGHGRAVHPHGMPPGQAKKVAHVHIDGCGHVYTGGAWVVVATGAGRGRKK